MKHSFVTALLFLVLFDVVYVAAAADHALLTQQEFDQRYPLVRPLVHDELRLLGWKQEEIQKSVLQESEDDIFRGGNIGNQATLQIPKNVNALIASENRETVYRLRAAIGHEAGHVVNGDDKRERDFDRCLSGALLAIGCAGLGASLYTSVTERPCADRQFVATVVGFFLWPVSYKLGSLAASRYREGQAEDYIRNDIQVLQARKRTYEEQGAQHKARLQEILKQTKSLSCSRAQAKEAFWILKRNNAVCNMLDIHPTRQALLAKTEQRIKRLQEQEQKISRTRVRAL